MAMFGEVRGCGKWAPVLSWRALQPQLRSTLPNHDYYSSRRVCGFAAVCYIVVLLWGIGIRCSN